MALGKSRFNLEKSKQEQPPLSKSRKSTNAPTMVPTNELLLTSFHVSVKMMFCRLPESYVESFNIQDDVDCLQFQYPTLTRVPPEQCWLQLHWKLSWHIWVDHDCTDHSQASTLDSVAKKKLVVREHDVLAGL